MAMAEQAMADKTPLWYVVHTYSGYENKVKDNLEKAVDNNPRMQQLIKEVRIPLEDAIELKSTSKGTKREIVQRKLLPGYVMVRMIMTNDSWYLVRNTRGVTGFVGPGSKPAPLSEKDILSLADKHEVTIVNIEVGDEVRFVGNGVFGADTVGTVTRIDTDTDTVTVKVNMLGREVETEVPYGEVERVTE